MAFQVIWSPTAKLDLADLATYIAEFDVVAGGNFVRSVFQSIERLPVYPESGRIVPELADPNIREVIKRPCRIVYRLKKKEHLVEIARIWHSARGKPIL